MRSLSVTAFLSATVRLLLPTICLRWCFFWAFSRSAAARIRSRDALALLSLGCIRVAGCALAIDKLETLGSISDYALAFLGGFGLNPTTSGFSAVVSRFKAGAP